MRLPRCSSTPNPRRSLFGAVLSATLVGCGGSLDGHDYDLTAQTPSSLSGTVALGAPMLDATVSVQDANGVVVSAPVERDGSYRGLSLVGLAAPLSLQACGSARRPIRLPRRHRRRGRHRQRQAARALIDRR